LQVVSSEALIQHQWDNQIFASPMKIYKGKHDITNMNDSDRNVLHQILPTRIL